MEIVKLSATHRSSQGAAALSALSNGAIGKGPARRLRRDGLIPAIAYGQKKEALPLAVAPKALKAVLLSEHGRNSVIELSVVQSPKPEPQKRQGLARETEDAARAEHETALTRAKRPTFDVNPVLYACPKREAAGWTGKFERAPEATTKVVSEPIAAGRVDLS